MSCIIENPQNNSEIPLVWFEWNIFSPENCLYSFGENGSNVESAYIIVKHTEIGFFSYFDVMYTLNKQKLFYYYIPPPWGFHWMSKLFFLFFLKLKKTQHLNWTKPYKLMNKCICLVAKKQKKKWSINPSVLTCWQNISNGIIHQFNIIGIFHFSLVCLKKI